MLKDEIDILTWEAVTAERERCFKLAEQILEAPYWDDSGEKLLARIRSGE